MSRTNRTRVSILAILGIGFVLGYIVACTYNQPTKPTNTAQANQADDADKGPDTTPVSADTAPTEEPPEPVPDSASPFPIDDYDERTAAEIVDLLTDLSAEELRLVDAYEEAQRNRVTIRNRIRRRLG